MSDNDPTEIPPPPNYVPVAAKSRRLWWILPPVAIVAALIVAGLVLVWPSPGEDFDPFKGDVVCCVLPPPEMAAFVGSADLAVTGKVTDISDGFVTVEVERVIKGARPETDTVKVQFTDGSRDPIQVGDETGWTLVASPGGTYKLVELEDSNDGDLVSWVWRSGDLESIYDDELEYLWKADTGLADAVREAAFVGIVEVEAWSDSRLDPETGWLDTLHARVIETFKGDAKPGDMLLVEANTGSEGGIVGEVSTLVASGPRKDGLYEWEASDKWGGADEATLKRMLNGQPQSPPKPDSETVRAAVKDADATVIACFNGEGRYLTVRADLTGSGVTGVLDISPVLPGSDLDVKDMLQNAPQCMFLWLEKEGSDTWTILNPGDPRLYTLDDLYAVIDADISSKK